MAFTSLSHTETQTWMFSANYIHLFSWVRLGKFYLLILIRDTVKFLLWWNTLVYDLTKSTFLLIRNKCININKKQQGRRHWRAGGTGPLPPPPLLPPTPTPPHFLEKKIFYVKSENSKFLLVNNIIYSFNKTFNKISTTLSIWIFYTYIHLCLKMWLPLKMWFPTFSDITLYAEIAIYTK